MSVSIRSYDHTADFDRVGEFLIELYDPEDPSRVWLQPRWEYMHYHPFILETDRTKIGLAEENGRLVGVVHFESDEGVVYFQVHPDYDHIKEKMFDYTEATFHSVSKRFGKERLAVFINDGDATLEALAYRRGFDKLDDAWEPNARLLLDKPLPEAPLPPGFSLKSLAEENDFAKINNVLWRGFNHPGPPPDKEIPGRKFAQEAPNFRHDLTIVAVAPDGNFVSFCGIWYVPQNQMTMVEPVATDPDYRRMGLGKAAVLEGIRRTVPLGSKVAWVGSNQQFYLSMGFKVIWHSFAWIKFL